MTADSSSGRRLTRRRDVRSAASSSRPPRARPQLTMHLWARSATRSSSRRRSSTQGRSWPTRKPRSGTINATRAAPQASPHRPDATADSARWIASSAASTSIQASGGRTSWMRSRPHSASWPSAERIFESSARKAAPAARRTASRPDRLHQDVALDRCVAMLDQERQQKHALTAREAGLHPDPAHRDADRSAEMDARAHSGREPRPAPPARQGRARRRQRPANGVRGTLDRASGPIRRTRRGGLMATRELEVSAGQGNGGVPRLRRGDGRRRAGPTLVPRLRGGRVGGSRLVPGGATGPGALCSRIARWLSPHPRPRRRPVGRSWARTGWRAAPGRRPARSSYYHDAEWGVPVHGEDRRGLGGDARLGATP